jgi:hypothetical protein
LGKKFIIYKLIQNWRDGLKKFIILFLTIILFFSIISNVAKGGFKIWPGKLTITMNEWFDKWEENKYNKIYITNPYSYSINVTVHVDHPSFEAISDGYSRIPDLSWVKVAPESLNLSPQSSEPVEIIIEVPKDEQSNHFNEKWETWVVFNSNLYPSGLGGMIFKLDLSVKLFINTPKSEFKGAQYLPILLFFFILVITVLIFTFYFKKKKGYLIKNNKN